VSTFDPAGVARNAGGEFPPSATAGAAAILAYAFLRRIEDLLHAAAGPDILIICEDLDMVYISLLEACRKCLTALGEECPCPAFPEHLPPSLYQWVADGDDMMLWSEYWTLDYEPALRKYLAEMRGYLVKHDLVQNFYLLEQDFEQDDVLGLKHVDRLIRDFEQNASKRRAKGMEALREALQETPENYPVAFPQVAVSGAPTRRASRPGSRLFASEQEFLDACLEAYRNCCAPNPTQETLADKLGCDPRLFRKWQAEAGFSGPEGYSKLLAYLKTRARPAS